MPQIRNTNIYPFDTTISNNDYVIGSDGDTSNKKTKNYRIGDLANYIAEYITVVVAGQDKILEGSVFPTDQDFTFASTPISYAYRSTFNVAPARTSIILDTPGSGMKRIDVFAIDVTTNTVVVVEGVEDASTPLEPSVDFGTQMRISAVLLDENGLVGLTRVQVYNENLGDPDEWQITETETGGGVFNPDSTTDPAVGTKSISCSTIVDGNILDFSSEVDSYSGFNSLYLRIKNTDVADLGIRVSMFNGVTQVSTIPVDIINGLYGYTLSNTSDHLFINVPLTEFGLTGDFDKLRFEFSSLTAPDVDLFYIDDIALIGGIEIPPQRLRWLDLIDTDSSYVGKARFIPMVNAFQTALRLVDSNQFLQVTDFYTGNAVLDPRVIWLGGMNYRILASRFIINNVLYTENVSTDVTLSDGDATNPRIDVFYIEKADADTPAVGGVAEGTPDASPTEETLDPDQAKVAIKIVAANETTSDVVEELVYNEDLGEPTEWDSSDLSADVDMDYAINPDTGSLCIQTNPTASVGTRMTFTKASSYTYNSEGILAIRMNIDFAWDDQVVLNIFLSDGTNDSNTVSISANELLNYGFDNLSTEEWQDLVIPMSEFGSALSTFTELHISTSNRGNLICTNYFDYIRFQVGITNTDPDNTGRQDLQEVLNEGGYATSPDGNTFWDVVLADGADGYWDLWIQDGDKLGAIYCDTTQVSMYGDVDTDNKSFIGINDGDMEIWERASGLITTLIFETPTVDNHIYLIPAREDAAGMHHLALSVNGNDADSEGNVTLVATSTPDTGTEIDLSNPLGNYCNRGSANSTATYTYANEVVGGKAKVLINKSGAAPTITDATLVAGSTFVASTDMDMCVEYNGTTVEYYFLER